MFCGAVFFLLGFHNVDQAFNLHTVNDAFGYKGFYDTSLLGQPYDEYQMYKIGWLLSFSGFFLTVMSSLYAFKPEKRNKASAYEDSLKL